jgi:uncharacterized membrane protein YcaP (DUF421 family)
METIEFLFGDGDDDQLSVLHMSLRALVVTAYCLMLLRISGRRAMALGTPIDNVYAILLGAVLSRTVTGASPFVPTIAAAATITLIHRLVSYVSLYSKRMGSLVKGQAKVVYRNGNFNVKNMRYCRISMHDLMAGVRVASGLDRLDEVKAIYVERNGQISVIRKQS